MDAQHGADIMGNRPISKEELQDFLAAKDLDASCERCGARSWARFDEGEGLSAGYLVASLDEPSIDALEAFPVVLLSCSNCGNIWSMSRKPILEWLRDRVQSVEASGS